MQMSLCEVSLIHTPVLAKLHETAFEKPWSEDEFKGLLTLPTTKGWVDETSLLLVSKVLDEIEILTILVHPEARGQGKAMALLAHLIEYAKQSDVCQIFLEVNVLNTPAICLYEKMGFKQTGVRKNYYKMKDGSFKDALLYQFVIEK